MARGRLTSSQEDLDRKRKVNKKELARVLRLYRFSLPYKGYFIAGMFFLVISTLTTLVFPKLAGEITEAASGNTQWILESVNEIALAFLGILLLQALASFFRIYLFAHVTEKSMADIRTTLYNKIIGLPLSFFEKNRVGDLVSRINADISQLESMLSFGLAELFRQLAVLIIGITILLVSYTELALVMLATFPVMIIVAIFFGRFVRKFSKKIQDKLAEANTIVEETFQAIQVVKAFTNEIFERKRYRGFIQQIVQLSLKTSLYRGAFVSFLIFTLFGGIVLVLWYGARLIQAGELETGQLIEFILYTIFIGASVAGMGDLYAQLQKTIGASERILGILEENEETKIYSEASFQKIYGDIFFEQVCFYYPTRPDIKVLKGVNLHIKAGNKIALVGQSGAGKSTIAQLLMKFYEISEGNIFVDKKPVKDWDIHTLRSQIAIVPQEVILFGGSIRENIAYGRPEATDEEILQAARQANAWEFIDSFPEKMATIVGERGVKLSGGQRQRIAIARALLKNPSILILDEATSALDAESEKLVQDALEVLMKGRTTIVIAHRLATIRKMDHIYVLSEGKIVEQGTHEELVQFQEGIYSHLFKLQMELAE